MQVVIGRLMFSLRKKSVKITDVRVRGTTEVRLDRSLHMVNADHL